MTDEQMKEEVKDTPDRWALNLLKLLDNNYEYFENLKEALYDGGNS